MGPSLDRFPHVPRESQEMLATDDLRDWDETFIKNVAREGLLLWTHGQSSRSPSNVPRIAPAESAAQGDAASHGLRRGCA